LRESGDLRALAVREALAFRQARHTRYPDNVESERALDINEGLASYTQTVLAAPSEADAIARGLELLAAELGGESFVCSMPRRQAGPEGCAPATMWRCC
jgi:hypothetical protein